MLGASDLAVELVVNVFERTYRAALVPGFFAGIEAEHRRRFDRKVALINNVTDPDDAALRARRLVAAGEIDAFYLVEERLDEALRATGLTRSELEPLLHYTDFVIVAATLPGCPWMLYWDPEAHLAEPADWVTPALELMKSDPRILAANPSWELPDARGARPGVERETLEISHGFSINPTFSDQVFLARRSDLAGPIYRQRCIGRLLYPTAHRAHIAEARIQAHMRHHGRLRATSLAATYVTDEEQGGSNYTPRGPVEAVRYARNAVILRALRVSPWRPRCLRSTWL